MKTFLQYLFWILVVGLFLGSVGSLRAHATTGSVYLVNICADLRNGGSLTEVKKRLEAYGFTEETAGYYAGTVVRSQCPDLIGYVMGQLA